MRYSPTTIAVEMSAPAQKRRMTLTWKALKSARPFQPSILYPHPQTVLTVRGDVQLQPGQHDHKARRLASSRASFLQYGPGCVIVVLDRRC